MIQEKTCKGERRAYGYMGCGKPINVKRRKYGLCPSCLFDWGTTTEAGRIWYQKQFLPKVEKNTEKHRKTENRKTMGKIKIELMTVDNYRKKYIQPDINKIARLIDHGHPCIATGNYGKMNGGHYLSVGANRTTALNLHNIFIQSFESNTFRGGDSKAYQDGLKEIFGQEYFEFVHSLRRHVNIKFTKLDYIDLRPKIKEVLKSLESDVRLRNPEERIALRNWANQELGIYQKEFSEFKSKRITKEK
ncbi:recombination protein NinG [Spongiimicrobium salis]|uniref:recombination protein NinG n=1 Tax=Spongiimicrobium salis TaxID=1667022 RepID=UPI00374DEEAE